MKMQAALLAVSGLILASAASAQTAGAPILAATADWNLHSAGPHQSINDSDLRERMFSGPNKFRALFSLAFGEIE